MRLADVNFDLNLLDQVRQTDPRNAAEHQKETDESHKVKPAFLQHPKVREQVEQDQD